MSEITTEELEKIATQRHFESLIQANDPDQRPGEQPKTL